LALLGEFETVSDLGRGKKIVSPLIYGVKIGYIHSIRKIFAQVVEWFRQVPP
jgi:hypothetical protein